jgi:predicted nucleic acid-binding protein
LIVVDTSALIDSLCGPKRSAPVLRGLIEAGERLLLPTVVLYEWLRGPRLSEELAAGEALFPRESTVPFGPAEAALAAELYGQVSRPRGREIDLIIAATALVREARLWTINSADFCDIPRLQQVSGSRD